jgi:hypothetical protein
MSRRAELTRSDFGMTTANGLLATLAGPLVNAKAFDDRFGMRWYFNQADDLIAGISRFAAAIRTGMFLFIYNLSRYGESLWKKWGNTAKPT